MSNDSSVTLTLGVIARDGEQFIEHSLHSIQQIIEHSTLTLHVILVDSASTDSTAKLMMDFAAKHDCVTVLQLEGDVNAAVARNAVLERAQNTHAFMIDGDIAIEPEFIQKALEAINNQEADAVYGRLPEIWHDQSGAAYDTREDRYHVDGRGYMKWFKGVVFLSNNITRTDLRYDTRLERLEDIEFSLRVADQFKILTLPLSMGTHYTVGYHTRTRLADFIRAQYQRPAGQFIRANLFRPDRLLTVKRSYIGYLVGLAMQFIVVLGLLFFSPLIIISGVALLAADAARFYRQGRFHEFLPLRIIGAWQLMLGFFTPRREAGPFTVSQLAASTTQTISSPR